MSNGSPGELVIKKKLFKFWIKLGATYTDMPCLHGTRSPEVNAFTIENVTQYSINVNLPQVHVSRVNTAILNDSLT